MKARHGYSLIEVLIAVAVLLVGIAAAASMSMTMIAYEEAGVRVSRALNQQEQAGRLYQLGLATSDIASILPAESSVISITFTNSSVAFTNIGNMERADCRMIFTTGPALTSTNQVAQVLRTNDIVLVRPSIR